MAKLSTSARRNHRMNSKVSFENLEDRRLMSATLPVVVGPMPSTPLKANPVAQLALQTMTPALVSKVTSSVSKVTMVSTSTTPTIAGFDLINSTTGSTIMSITDGMTIDLSSLPTRNVNVVPVVTGGTKSVFWDYDNVYQYNLNNTAPFGMATTSNWTPTLGTHKLFALAANDLNGGGTRSDQTWLNFSVIDSGAGTTSALPTITGYNLINNATGAVIAPIANGSTIDIGKLPTANVNIVPVVNSMTKSVFWDYDGQYQYNLTNTAPFSLSATSPWTPTVGSHQLFALAASDLNGGGSRSDQAWLNFNVVNSSPANPSTGSTNSTGTNSTVAATGAPNAVITSLGTSIMAGNGVDVQATGTTLTNGTPITTTYLWNFGDPNGKYNSYEGFNAAHVYDTPGNYTVTLTVTDNTGKVGTATTTINVAADTRKAIYMSNSGNDANNGLTPATAIKSVDRAAALLTDGTKLLLHRGETYDFDDYLYIQHSNIVVSDYGNAALAGPVVRRAASNPSLVWLIGTSAATTNITIQDITFDSATPSNWNKDGAATAIEPMGKDLVVRNCLVNCVNSFVNAESQPDGLLIQDNNSPGVTAIRSYFLWAQGADITVLGNTVANVTREHVLRVGGADRINVSFNNFTNLNRTDVDSQDIAKGCFVFQKGTYFFVNSNISNDGGIGVGPLGGPDGAHDPNASATWAVVKNNQVNGTLIQILPGANHVALDNNIVHNDGGNAFNINAQDMTTNADGTWAYPNRNINDINIFSNTAINLQPIGNFIMVNYHANAGTISLTNNLFVDPVFTTGSYQSAAVYDTASDLSAFSKISGNVWPTPVAYLWVPKAEFYIAPSWGTESGYLTAAQWASFPQVSGDVYGSTALPSGAYAETILGVTAGAHLA